MKNLKKYTETCISINEHIKSLKHPRFVCSRTKEEISSDKILEYSVSNRAELAELFNRMYDGEFGNNDKFIVCLAKWALGNTLIVNTEDTFKYEDVDGIDLLNK